ncbi:hypothetical protein JR316_0008922 [Psilocybe cubensis]|uniref:Uncharacterized protein n=1 Tax=Psilocybe cubensis TaxID=181762 RepID=A0ACB8GSY8_PSICU|nr:hypothetical protein JR316_0008922 [Psilocybe cubensis]KAH9478467.1 hypothetical protein JR316_0008922 [Psilocybe cubensis]
MSCRRIQPQGAGARAESRSTFSPTQPVVAASLTPNSEQHSVASDASSGSRCNAYCGLQQEVSALKAQNTALKAELADMKLEQRHSANALDSSSTDMSSDVKKWGRYFSLFFNTFVTVSTFASTLPKVLFASDSATRYLTDANEAIGPTVELYEQIPLKYHPIMKLAAQSKGKKFVKLFRDAISASHSTSISQLRNNSGPIIFNLPSAYFESDFSSKRIAVPEIRALLGYNADFADSEEGKKFPEKAYARFPPVLCKDEDSSKVENRFRNGKLFMVARAIIFGKKAAKAKSLAIGREPSYYLRSDMPAATTFGLIALISGITRFTLSPDTRFDNGGVGPETGIDYTGDINYYKKYLTVLRDDPSTASYVNRLLKEWDAEVFSTHNAAMKRSSDDADREVIDMDNISDEIEQDIQRLHVAEAATNTDQINDTMQDLECDTMANNRSTDLQPEDPDFIPNPIALGRAQSFLDHEHQSNSDRGSNFDIDDDQGSWADNDCIHIQEPAAEAEYVNIPEKEIHTTSSSRALDNLSVSPFQPALNSAKSSATPAGLTAYSEPPRRSTRSDTIRTTKANVDTPGSSDSFNPMLQAVDPANCHPLLMHSDSAAAVNHGSLEASAQEKAPPKRGTKTAARGRGKNGRK